MNALVEFGAGKLNSVNLLGIINMRGRVVWFCQPGWAETNCVAANKFSEAVMRIVTGKPPALPAGRTSGDASFLKLRLFQDDDQSGK